MNVRLALASFALALAVAPVVSYAQQGAGAPTGPVHRHDVRANASDDAYNDPAGLVRECLAECFATDPSLRAGVCGGETHPGELSRRCFGSGTPACDRAARAISTGANLLAAVSRRCQEPPTPSAAARPAIAEVDRDAIRRRREQRADAQCGSAGALRAMCRRCVSSGDRAVWLAGDFSPAVIRMMAGRSDLAPPSDAEEYRFRCQGTDTVSLAGAVGSLARAVESDGATLRGLQADVNGLHLTGAAPASETVEVLRVLALGQQRVMAQAVIRQAENDLRFCQITQHDGQRCADERRMLNLVQEQYAGLLSSTQGLDVHGITPFIERLARVREACRQVVGENATACLSARQGLTDALTAMAPRPAASRSAPRALARGGSLQGGAHGAPAAAPVLVAPALPPAAAPAPVPAPSAPSPTGEGTVVYPEFE